jgi:hypothetical protein
MVLSLATTECRLRVSQPGSLMLHEKIEQRQTVVSNEAWFQMPDELLPPPRCACIRVSYELLRRLEQACAEDACQTELGLWWVLVLACLWKHERFRLRVKTIHFLVHVLGGGGAVVFKSWMNTTE